MASIISKALEFLRNIDLKDRWVRVIIAVIVAFILFIIFFTPKNDISKINALTNSTVPTEVSTDVEVMYSDSARVKAKLNTPRMVRFLTADQVLEMPKGLNVLFYDKFLKPDAKLRANYGIRYLTKNLTIVKGNVVVVNVQGDTLNSEELIWHEDKEKVTSDKFVKVKTKTEIILADGFESDLTFTHYTFYKIRGTIQLKDKQ